MFSVKFLGEVVCMLMYVRYILWNIIGLELLLIFSYWDEMWVVGGGMIFIYYICVVE